jgi:hypothetical protein
MTSPGAFCLAWGVKLPWAPAAGPTRTQHTCLTRSLGTPPIESVLARTAGERVTSPKQKAK